MSALRAEVVTSESGLRALAPEWEALWQRAPEATAFQSPHWLLPWWDAFGSGRPVLACLRTEGRLAGLLPLYVLDADLRKLLPVGVGVSDYLDALFEPGLPDHAAGLMLEAGLRAGFASGAEVCDLVDVPPHSPLRRAAAGWCIGPPCPVLTLPPGAPWDVAVPLRMCRNLRTSRHRAERAGGWAVEHATRATLDVALSELLRQHAGRWGGMDEAAEAFTRAAAPGLLQAGLLRLACLRVAGDAAAFCAALTDHAGRLMLYLVSFDPAFSPFSPGSLLIAAVLDEAVREGCRELHFLRGDEAYKYAWGAKDRHNASCRIRPA